MCFGSIGPDLCAIQHLYCILDCTSTRSCHAHETEILPKLIHHYSSSILLHEERRLVPVVQEYVPIYFWATISFFESKGEHDMTTVTQCRYHTAHIRPWWNWWNLCTGHSVWQYKVSSHSYQKCPTIRLPNERVIDIRQTIRYVNKINNTPLDVAQFGQSQTGKERQPVSVDSQSVSHCWQSFNQSVSHYWQSIIQSVIFKSYSYRVVARTNFDGVQLDSQHRRLIHVSAEILGLSARLHRRFLPIETWGKHQLPVRKRMWLFSLRNIFGKAVFTTAATRCMNNYSKFILRPIFLELTTELSNTINCTILCHWWRLIDTELRFALISHNN